MPGGHRQSWCRLAELYLYAVRRARSKWRFNRVAGVVLPGRLAVRLATPQRWMNLFAMKAELLALFPIALEPFFLVISAQHHSTMTELILIRHGETDWNRELRFQGQVDAAERHGPGAACRVAQRLLAERFGVEHLVCSDRRCARGRRPSLRRRRCCPTCHWTPWRPRAARAKLWHCGRAAKDVKTDYAEAWERWVRFEADYGMPGGETTRQFHTRVMDAVQRIAQQYAGKTVLVVTHGGVPDMVWRTAQGLGLDGPRQSDIPNAGLNRARVQGGAIEVLHWADTRHLQDFTCAAGVRPDQAGGALAPSLRRRADRSSGLPPIAPPGEQLVPGRWQRQRQHIVEHGRLHSRSRIRASRRCIVQPGWGCSSSSSASPAAPRRL